jgi:hypothetical protein
MGLECVKETLAYFLRIEERLDIQKCVMIKGQSERVIKDESKWTGICSQSIDKAKLARQQYEKVCRKFQ